MGLMLKAEQRSFVMIGGNPTGSQRVRSYSKYGDTITLRIPWMLFSNHLKYMDKSHPKSDKKTIGFLWFYPNDQLVICKIFSNHFLLLIFTVEDTRVRSPWMLDIVSVRQKCGPLSANQTWHWKKTSAFTRFSLVVWNMAVMTFHILGMSWSQLTKSIIFQRGEEKPPNSRWWSHYCRTFIYRGFPLAIFGSTGMDLFQHLNGSSQQKREFLHPRTSDNA